MHVGLILDSARASRSLWSLNVDDPGDRTSLRQRIAAQVSDVVRCAGQSGVASLPTEALSTYLSACAGLRRQDRPELVLWRQQFKRLTAEAPTFSRAYSGLALVDSYIAERGVPPAEAATLLAEGRRAAQRALELNPRDGVAFAAQARMIPHHEWLTRERLLRKGLAAAPVDPELHSALADLLVETGRVEESTAERERAWALDPISPLINSGLAYAWSGMGRDRQAEALTAATVARFPTYAGSWRVSMRTLLWSGRIAEARALAADLPAKGSRMTPAEIADWRTLSANLPLKGAALTPAAHAALVRLAFAQRSIVQVDAMLLLARLGDLDTTFAAAHRLRGTTDGSTVVLFNPPAEAMWRDPRAMRLANELGLVAYWRASGVWPDVCRLPDLSYDCKTEAAKVAGAS
ncbi:tetratricopeptide repeat protein [Phenylobacterium aquaticum]|uniref:tetratricopeptide repeat protein n=1 Tax=Phenylobacterium aquaticum TaxID=1763816 RepID=UPI001F5CC319|nr:hypothetical protein [Phenylobacterium aquaticum]MCI3133617.1 hypothetical protein [Phenylobacterium aquaticum]